MSKVDLNALVNGFSERGGNAVLVRCGKSTLLSSGPKKRMGQPRAKEKAQRDRSKRAAVYAKAKMTDPCSQGEEKCDLRTSLHGRY